ncbi:MAG: hypothetical protein H6807_14150 [Planctomycetes bacterium]|nr:hypothetical protein [Planctomycetota bacterium]
MTGQLVPALILCACALLVACGGGSAPVVINGRALDESQLADFEQRYGARPTGGPWWYDARSGLFGPMGQPAAGFLQPGHDLGPLAADASGGGTGVWVNGRELAPEEYVSWSMLFGQAILPGRYWLDGQANFGFEGFPAGGNLLQVMAARLRAGGGGGSGGRGGDNFWTTRFSAGNSTADNSQGYVSVPGIGPVSHGM